ncbi:hypothetical protein B620_gp41 [Croceibacter phage P2559S]|uniref:hypothetical protein n=1 Tax=Croceibacter phage P2559S TaxID=1176422 RepID=UPI0002688EC4|nr:hypothetical protein B620_gp41 [Croceibacter phage P2559S]AFM54819.1 hypothetical protein P2559S_41 [Croceibacter phage P2559S]
MIATAVKDIFTITNILQMEKQKPALRIDEALDYHEATKAKSTQSLQKKDLGELLFADAKPKTQVVNISNLITGKTSRVAPAWVRKICKATGVDANFLFGIKPMDSKKLDKYESGTDRE